ncbi:ABC transporter permease subunit [Cryobacterium sp. PAMC25264]|uniref:ABC transporter permease subunit n=1 Tax=Cryobacterium sp. PAMC25264 TaxID=2861288 RepID=UPI001C636F25|nr:ABC transporter permease subunit [Cryobacterium sp. PAMC25264]QYF74424.1 ABC transporter permease [Cryobacterium sp. PAMC25264]
MSSTATKVFTPSGHDLRFGGILWSEWVKLRSVRSTWWLYGMLVAVTAGLGAQMSSSHGYNAAELEPEGVQALGVFATTVSTDFTGLIVSILAVLFMAGEYGSGMISTTLTSVPKRLPALLGKALVFAVATFAVSAVAVAITIPLSVAVLSGTGIDIDLGDPLYWRAQLGVVLYLVLTGLIAFAIGAILRSTAGGIAVALGLLLAAPIAFGLLTLSSSQIWIQNVQALLPTELGKALFSHPGRWELIAPGAPMEPLPAGLWVLEPWQAGLLLLAWVTVLLAVAAPHLKRRDA